MFEQYLRVKMMKKLKKNTRKGPATIKNRYSNILSVHTSQKDHQIGSGKWINFGVWSCGALMG
jgi:hypothetical protein